MVSKIHKVYDSDISDYIFDNIKDDREYETDDTDIEDVDVEDQIQLFNGNTHPPDYYRQAVENFNTASYEAQDYADGSTSLINAIEAQWDWYCKHILGYDPQNCYESINLALLQSFFDWCLNQKRTPNGRVKRGIKKKSSLGTCWKVFRLAYERRMGSKIDPILNRQMHRVLRRLATKYELSEQRRQNRCMTIDTLKEQIETTLSTTRKSFKMGELRILAVLFLLLLAPEGARPTSVLKLRYRDIRVILARDPDGGPHRLLLSFTLAFTKTYLGEKDAKSFYIPETLFDPSLLLSPHVFLLGILFRHQAFRARNLTSPQQLDTLDIHPEENELLLPLREDLKDTFIFRRVIQDVTGYTLSPDEHIPYGMMAAWIKRIGELLGIEHSTIAYSLRYNAANSLDQSVDVSEALRNSALGHSNSDPFQHHYLGLQMDCDFWSILRGMKPQKALIKQSCGIGHSKSKRRPVGLSSDQSASIKNYPEVAQWRKRIERLPRGTQEYLEAQRNLKNATQRRRLALKAQVRARWTAEQAVEDIESQLKGIGFSNSIGDECSRPLLGSQKRLVDALNEPMALTLKGQYKRRDDAIDAISAYCIVEEGCTPPENHIFSKQHNNPKKLPDFSDSNAEMMRLVTVIDEKTRPLRCFMCVAKVLHLEPDDPHRERGCRKFFASTDLTKHFKRMHLSKMQDIDEVWCGICDIPLETKGQFRNHAQRIHGIVTRDYK